MVSAVGQQAFPKVSLFIERTVKPLTQAAISVAIEAIFLSAVVLMSAAAFPIHFHPVVLPIITLSSILFAAHFYMEAPLFRQAPLKIPLFSPAPDSPPVPLPAEAPRGFSNPGNSCAFCATLQLLLSDPALEGWMKQQPLFQQEIQPLREALHRVDREISPSLRVQVDAGQVMTAMLDALPEPLQWKATIRQYIDGGELDPQGENSPFLILNMDEERDLQTLLNRRLEAPGTNSVRRRSGEEVPIQRVVTEIREAPSALRLQLARFRYTPLSPPPPWWAFWRVRSGGVSKKGGAIEVPEELALPVGGGVRRYRLASFVHHNGGSSDSGHYIAGRVVGEGRYLIDDERVRLASPEEWRRLSREAYLFSYV